MMRCLFFLACLAVELSLSAASVKFDTLKAGFVTYSNVTVVGVNATDLFFTHSKGISNVRLKLLSPELQKQFHYNPAEAERVEEAQAESDALYLQWVASNIVETAQRQREAKAARQADLQATQISDPLTAASPLGKPAPPLAVEKWANEAKPVLQGKFLLVYFFSPASVACQKQVSALNEFQKKFGDELTVAGICSQPESELEQMEGDKIEFPCGIDAQSKFAAALGVTTVPTVLLLDPNRVVRYLGHPAALSEAALRGFLAVGNE